MKKILMSLLIIGAVAALIGGGVYAAFSDPEATTGNTFTAGTIDLKVNDAEWATAISLTNWRPGVDSNTYTFKNTGSLDGDLVFTWGALTASDHANDTSNTFEFAASGTTPNPDMEMDANQYGRLIYVTLTNGGGATGVITESSIAGNNGDGKISLYELTTYSGTVATLPAYISDETLAIKFTLGDAFNGGSGSNPPSDWTNYLTAQAKLVSTTVAATATAGQPNITVAAAGTLAANDVIEIGTPGSATFEAGVIQSVAVNVITLTQNLANAHAIGEAVVTPTYQILAGSQVWNVPQADGLTVNITATLNQQ